MSKFFVNILYLLVPAFFVLSCSDDPTTQAPYITVKIDSPANGSVLTQSPVKITATTKSSCDCQHYVEFKLDGVLLYTDYASPYEFSLDITTIAGMHTIRTDAFMVGKANGSDSVVVKMNQ